MSAWDFEASRRMRLEMQENIARMTLNMERSEEKRTQIKALIKEQFQKESPEIKASFPEVNFQTPIIIDLTLDEEPTLEVILEKWAKEPKKELQKSKKLQEKVSKPILLKSKELKPKKKVRFA